MSQVGISTQNQRDVVSSIMVDAAVMTIVSKPKESAKIVAERRTSSSHALNHLKEDLTNHVRLKHLNKLLAQPLAGKRIFACCLMRQEAAASDKDVFTTIEATEFVASSLIVVVMEMKITLRHLKNANHFAMML